jgi:hypothetical protein
MFVTMNPTRGNNSPAWCSTLAIKKLDGVESVDVSLEKASADIRLKGGNTITLPQLRRIIREGGHPTKDARVEARGTFVERNGKPVLDLQNGSFLELAPGLPCRRRALWT